MTSKRIAQTNQQQKSDKPQGSGILQRASVRSTEDQETLTLSNSAFSKDFSQVPISTTKPQQIMARLKEGAKEQHGQGEPIQRQEMSEKSGVHKENKTGLPDKLKAGTENLSGFVKGAIAINSQISDSTASLEPPSVASQNSLPIQCVQIETGVRLKSLLWDTESDNQIKAKRIKKFTEKNKKIVITRLEEDDSQEAKEDLKKINDPNWAEANDKKELLQSNTGGAMPQGKSPGSGTRTIHMNYRRRNAQKTISTELEHLKFFVKTAEKLKLKLVIMTTESAKPDVTEELKKYDNIDAQIIISKTEMSQWAEDSAEFLTNNKLAVLTEFNSKDIQEGMESGRQDRWSKIPGLEKEEISKLSEAVKIGALVNAGDARTNRIAAAKQLTGEPATNIRAYMEGGNLIPGKDKEGNDIVLVGKDSVAATANAYKINEETVREIIQEDFGLSNKNQVLFVEQPGRFHLDMGLLLIDQGRVLVNDSKEEFEKSSPGKEVPKSILQRKALEDQAADDLREGGLTVIRKPLASDKFNFFNGEFVQDADCKEYFLTNDGLTEEQEKEVYQYYVEELKIVVGVMFSPKQAAKESLKEQGGVGCRIKGAPFHNATTSGQTNQLKKSERPQATGISQKKEISRTSSKSIKNTYGVIQENKTGLPDNLKAGIENLSSISMEDVKVHYNSSKPAQLQALAYTQGKDIYVGSGQEKHLAHEAWHVVQQKQGRVNPTMQIKGVAVNDDSVLEKEADVMGARAARMMRAEQIQQDGRGINHSIVQAVFSSNAYNSAQNHNLTNASLGARTNGEGHSVILRHELVAAFNAANIAFPGTVNMERLREAEDNEDYIANQAHHIVEVNDRGAAFSRERLAYAGIDINSAINGVILPSIQHDDSQAETLHRGSHIAAYSQAVERAIRNALMAAHVTSDSTRGDIVLALNTIVQTLTTIRNLLISQAVPINSGVDADHDEDNDGNPAQQINTLFQNAGLFLIVREPLL